MGVAKDLHVNDYDDDSEETYLIATKVINNPVPRDFTLASIELLTRIKDMDCDSVLI